MPSPAKSRVPEIQPVIYEFPKESTATALTGALEDPVPSPPAIHEKVGAVEVARTVECVAGRAMKVETQKATTPATKICRKLDVVNMIKNITVLDSQ
jgi:hypothetical protein